MTPPLGGGGSVLGISPHSPSLHQVKPLTNVFLATLVALRFGQLVVVSNSRSYTACQLV